MVSSFLGSGCGPSVIVRGGEPTGELSLDERAELKRLRRQVEELRKDNELAGGKAAAFFASKRPPLNGMS